MVIVSSRSAIERAEIATKSRDAVTKASVITSTESSSAVTLPALTQILFAAVDARTCCNYCILLPCSRCRTRRCERQLFVPNLLETIPVIPLF